MLDGYTEIKCPCGYFIDYQTKGLKELDSWGYGGFRCPHCNRVYGSQFLE